MSTTEQKETELVSGTIEGIIQKGADKWQVAVKPAGSQYDKKLWTKDAELVTALSAKIGQTGAFVCGVSHWTNNEGKPVRSLWIDSLGDDRIPDAYITPQNPTGSVATPAAAPQARPPVLGGDKDRLIVRQVCIKAAAEMVAGCVEYLNVGDDGSVDYALEVMKAAQRFETWCYRDLEPPPF